MYLLSYAHTAAGPQLSILAPARQRPAPPGQPEPHRPVIPPENGPGRPLIDGWIPASRLEQFTAADDQAARYQMTVLPMAGGPDGWTLLLHPRPAHEPRWLDLTTSPGQPAVRLDLTPPAPAQQDATVTVTTAPASPGEHMLQAIAAKLLTTLLAASSGPDPAGPQPGPLGTAADGLGQVITALQAAGALSPFSPVPGQLAALCAVLPASGHGITAPPARDLPAPWRSMLATTAGNPRRRGTAAPPSPSRSPNSTGSAWPSSACTTARAAPSCTCTPAARNARPAAGPMNYPPGR